MFYAVIGFHVSDFVIQMQGLDNGQDNLSPFQIKLAAATHCWGGALLLNVETSKSITGNNEIVV